MLQQTRVEAVIPYFEKWMRLFPNVQALANASEHHVLNAWEGLGYYSRARNLHKAAQIVADQHHGEIPRDLEELRKLPGIGRYTLGAIASIAFGMDVSALDGNIKRVYARLFDIEEPVDSPAGEQILWKLADGNLPEGNAGDYNQALMDLGAAICIPKNPRCLICPLMKLCKARQRDTQNQRPVKTPKKEVPHYVHAAAVIVQRGRVLLAQRPSDGLLGGMWEFPNGRVDGDPAAGLPRALKTGYRLGIRVQRVLRAERSGAEPQTARAPRSRHLHRTICQANRVQVSGRRSSALGIVEHGYSHFSVTVHIFACELISKPKETNLKWVSLNSLKAFPMGKIDRQIAKMITK
jgi:A/G-specific adenine glycosylase